MPVFKFTLSIDTMGFKTDVNPFPLYSKLKFYTISNWHLCTKSFHFVWALDSEVPI